MPSELFIQQLKQYSDIEQIVSSYVPLKKKGRYLTGLCPFHSEKTPSFFVYPQTQSFYCFGCGAGGDVITFIRRIENLEYMEAVRLLAEGKTCRVVALQGENYVDYDITEALQMSKSLDQHTYEVMRALTGVQ